MKHLVNFCFYLFAISSLMVLMTKTFDSEISFYSLRSISLPRFTLHILMRNKAFIQYEIITPIFWMRKLRARKRKKSKDHTATQWHSQGPNLGTLFQSSQTHPLCHIYVGIKQSAEVKQNKQEKPQEFQSNTIFIPV